MIKREIFYNAISPYFRRRRMHWFETRVDLQPQERLLDVGGDPLFWAEAMLPNPTTVLNEKLPPDAETRWPRFTFRIGDACALPFADDEFDVVFSNSVIEHVGTWEQQMKFAAEARRTGRKLWIQTPAYEFFMDPHLLTPFIHWLPVRWQRRLFRNFTVIGLILRPSIADVDTFLARTRMLKRHEIPLLFPDCEILEEKFLGMTKSYIAMRKDRG